MKASPIPKAMVRHKPAGSLPESLDSVVAVAGMAELPRYHLISRSFFGQLAIPGTTMATTLYSTALTNKSVSDFSICTGELPKHSCQLRDVHCFIREGELAIVNHLAGCV